jgi:hypothetical protein
MGGGPQVLAYHGDRIRERGLDFAIPYRLTNRQRVLFRDLARPQGDHREEPQQGWGGAGDGPRVPLPLRFQTQMGTGLLPGHFEAPPEDKPLQDLDGVHRQVRTQHGLGFERLLGVAHQHPADGQRRHSRVIPHGCGRDELHTSGPCAIPATQRRRHPQRGRVGQDPGQSGQALAFEVWPAMLAWLPMWSRVVQGGIQPQARDATDGLRHPTQPPPQGHDGDTAFGHQHQGALRHPAPHHQEHLARPVGQLLMPLASVLMVTLGRRQHGRERQGPHALGPGNRHQEHRTQPA